MSDEPLETDGAGGTVGGGPSNPDRTATGGRAAARPVSERRAWLAVARKDFADAGRSWQLYVLAAAFLSLIALSGLTPWLRREFGPPPPPEIELPPLTGAMAMESMAGMVAGIVPLVVLVLGYMSIVGERERGSLRVLLGLPVSRRDVVVGTFVGRTAVVWTAMLGGFAATGLAVFVLFDSVELLTYAQFVASTLGYAGVFVAMAVGISALARSRARAIGLVITTFSVVTFLWRQLLVLVQAASGVAVESHLGAPDVSAGWYVFLQRAQPGDAWRLLTTDWVVPVVNSYSRGDEQVYVSYTTAGPEPFYLDTWFLALVLLLWGVLPLAIGYVRFTRADIG